MLTLRRALVGLASACFVILSIQASLASAADTTEGYRVGVTDFEMYTTYDTASRSFGIETLIGAGLTERFSIGVAHLAWINPQGGAILGEIGFELFHNLVDTEHFDFDLMAECGLGTPNVDNVHGFHLGVELNLDWQSFGFYSRLFLDNFQEKADDSFRHAASTLLGARYHLLSGGELLFEANIDWGDQGCSGGGVAMGFNLTLADWLELILEMGYGFAAAEDRESIQVLFGAICTM